MDDWMDALFGGKSVAEMADDAQDKLADYAAAWQGDTADDALARAIIGSTNLMIEASKQAAGQRTNRLIFQVFVRQFLATMQTLTMLNELADLRGKER